MSLCLRSRTICYYIVTTLCLVRISGGSDNSQCSCYTFDWRSSSWSYGRDQCRTQGGDLVSMETLEEWGFINSQIQNRTAYNDEWWIGLEKRDGKWKWLRSHLLRYNMWQPQKPRGQYKCVVMAKNYPKNTYGLFDNVRCDNFRGWICEYKKKDCSNNQVKWCKNPVTPTVKTISKTDQEVTTTTTTAATATSGRKTATSDSPISTSVRQPTTKKTTTNYGLNVQTPSTTTTSNKVADSSTNTPYNNKPTQHKTTPLQVHKESDPITSDNHKLTNTDCLPYPLLVIAIFVNVLGGLTVLATVAFFLVPFLLKKTRSSIV